MEQRPYQLTPSVIALQRGMFYIADNRPGLDSSQKAALVYTVQAELMQLASHVEDGLNRGLWHRKNFEDFKYIEVDMTETQYVWFFIIIVLLNIGLSVFVVKNDFTNDSYGFRY